MKKIFNASNILGAVAFCSMIATVGAVEAENDIGTLVFLVLFAGCAYLSLREDGAFRQKNRPR